MQSILFQNMLQAVATEVPRSRGIAHLDGIFQQWATQSISAQCFLYRHFNPLLFSTQDMNTLLHGHIQKTSFFREHREEEGRRSDEVSVPCFFLRFPCTPAEQGQRRNYTTSGWCLTLKVLVPNAKLSSPSSNQEAREQWFPTMLRITTCSSH